MLDRGLANSLWSRRPAARLVATRCWSDTLDKAWPGGSCNRLLLRSVPDGSRPIAAAVIRPGLRCGMHRMLVVDPLPHGKVHKIRAGCEQSVNGCFCERSLRDTVRTQFRPHGFRDASPLLR